MNIQFDPLLSSDYSLFFLNCCCSPHCSQIAYNVFQTDLYSEYVPRVRAKIVKSQFGFMTKRNTVTQLIHYLDALYDCLDQNIPFLVFTSILLSTLCLMIFSSKSSHLSVLTEISQCYLPHISQSAHNVFALMTFAQAFCP